MGRARLVGTPPGMMAAHRSSPGFDPTRQRGPTVWDRLPIIIGKWHENGTILGWSMDFTNPIAGMFEPGATVDADGGADGD